MGAPPHETVETGIYPSTAAAGPRELAKALVRHARETGYAKRLYAVAELQAGRGNERERARTWWIAPGRRQPVSRYGKIMVTSRYGGTAPQAGGPPARRGGATLFVALCIQKGLDPRAAGALRARRREAWVMTAQPRWVWEDFVPEMAAGYIDPLAAKVEESGGSPLTVVLDARDPEGEERSETIAFEWSHGEMTLLPSPHRRARGYLREFSSAGTLMTLARRLRYAPQCMGLWLDLAVGVRLWVNRKGRGAVIWDENRTWESACRPWSLWLR